MRPSPQQWWGGVHRWPRGSPGGRRYESARGSETHGPSGSTDITDKRGRGRETWLGGLSQCRGWNGPVKVTDITDNTDIGHRRRAIVSNVSSPGVILGTHSTG